MKKIDLTMYTQEFIYLSFWRLEKRLREETLDSLILDKEHQLIFMTPEVSKELEQYIIDELNDILLFIYKDNDLRRGYKESEIIDEREKFEKHNIVAQL